MTRSKRWWRTRWSSPDAPDPTPEEAYEDMFAVTPPEIERYANSPRADGGAKRGDHQ